MKRFSLTDDFYDQDSYLGRVLNFYDVINPLRLFTSDSAIADHKKLLADFEHGRLDAEVLKTDEIHRKLWNAKSVLGAVLHPDTGEKVTPLFIPCGFIPANVPICAGMLLSAPTPFNAALWQWANQSYNAGFNFFNRPISSGSNDDSAVRDTLIAYLSATGVSCSVALGLNAWLKNAKLSPVMRRNLGVAVPFTAVAGAGAFNVFAMRFKETQTGVAVTHPETNEELGMSKNVAYAALGQCATSRVVLPAPILLIPPFVIPVVRAAAPRIAAKKVGQAMLDLSVLITALTFALPFAIALFPQRGSYPVSSLEPELREKAEKLGLTHVRFNKGL
eukprot:TRINITY_DN52065_c0_g1_i1.p1 TRINITY_DN52065_c0_g1~~TRINITY_DN52065_c0_g1_i1.p1  ORF type:complete len:333 (+),score=118.17 TRINITY_DN52065_c0_g1_i1:61-1059(+)